MTTKLIDPIADDTLEGIAEIAAFLGKTERQVVWLLTNKQLPAFKLSNRWHLRKSTYLAFLDKLETAAMPASVQHAT